MLRLAAAAAVCDDRSLNLEYSAALGDRLVIWQAAIAAMTANLISVLVFHYVVLDKKQALLAADGSFDRVETLFEFRVACLELFHLELQLFYLGILLLQLLVKFLGRGDADACEGR